jgi:RNA polymerase sigma-70 factor, ECF subfamily
MGPVSDDKLLAALQAREPAAVRQMISTHSAAMHAVARRILGSEEEAREVVQEAFFRAFQSLANFRGASALSTWLHRIAINEALMALRSRRSRIVEAPIEVSLPRFYEDGHHMPAAPGWSEPADVLLQRGQVRAAIAACIERLPTTLRVVLVLRDVEGLDGKETAAALDISEAVVKTRLHRARQALRALLEQELLK